MNIPKIRKLPSGAWTCQLRVDGQSISITDFDRDIVEAKAYAYKAGILKARRTPEDLTVGGALQKYIDSRRDIISPSTLRGYEQIKKHRFLTLQKVRIAALTAAMVQRAVNAEAKLCAPKTIKNAYRLIVSAIEFAGGEKFERIKLPQIPAHNKKYLTPAQITVFCEAIKGTRVEIPALLALWSCRRSELLALEWSSVDLSERKIRLEQSAVIGSDGELVVKSAMKNRTSARTIPISQQLYEALTAVPESKRVGRVVDYPPESVYKATNRVCKKYDLPEVGVHGLRHSFASLAHHLNMPLKQAMAIGGWADDHTMLQIYTHVEQDEAALAADMLKWYDGSDENADDANENANVKPTTA